MEKISGILPANSRLTSVDLKSSNPIRGGMPTFGRNVGVTAAAERQMELEKETAKLASQQHLGQMDLRIKNPKEEKQNQIVQTMADKFFMKKTMADEQVQTELAAKPEVLTTDLTTIDLKKMAEEATTSDPDAVPGQYLDVQA